MSATKDQYLELLHTDALPDMGSPYHRAIPALARFALLRARADIADFSYDEFAEYCSRLNPPLEVSDLAAINTVQFAKRDGWIIGGGRNRQPEYRIEPVLFKLMEEPIVEPEQPAASHGLTAPIRTLIDSGNWRDQAKCRELKRSFKIFFPDYDIDSGPAKSVCAECPVIDDCLEFALVNREEHGIWGGLTRTERDARLRIRRLAGRG